MDAAIARTLEVPKTLRSQREAALAEARAELVHIAEAIRRGVVTPTTKAMLEEAEGRVAALEAAVTGPRQPVRVTSLASSVEQYLSDLRGTVGREH